MDACCCLGRLYQQKAQQRAALLADVPQPLLTSTGVLTRNHAHVRADLLAALKPRRSSDDSPEPAVVNKPQSARVEEPTLLCNQVELKRRIGATGS
jgi:hypothetical protein